MVANLEHIVNPNCLSSVLLSHLRRICGIEEEHIDLATEMGDVIDLGSKAKEYAKKYLDGRGTYVIVKIVGEESEEGVVYVPLLDNIGDKVKFSLLNPKAVKRSKEEQVVTTAAVAVAVSSNNQKEQKRNIVVKTDVRRNASSPKGSQEDLKKKIQNQPASSPKKKK